MPYKCAAPPLVCSFIVMVFFDAIFSSVKLIFCLFGAVWCKFSTVPVRLANVTGFAAFVQLRGIVQHCIKISKNGFFRFRT